MHVAANSPDLNLIESLWDKIKGYIQEECPEIHKFYPQTRAAVYDVCEVGNSITTEDVQD